MDLDPRLRAGSADLLSSGASDASDTPSPSSQLAASSAAEAHATIPGPQHSDSPSTAGTVQNPLPANDQHDDAKRSRACEACRGLKVRCEPDPADEGPCKRCRKAGRSCVVTAPTRKRQKKTDSRVAELEKKIDALTASLQSRAAPGAHAASPVVPSPVLGRGVVDDPSGHGMVWGNGATRHWSMGTPTTGVQHVTPPAPLAPVVPQRERTPVLQPPMVMAGKKRKALDRGDTVEDERAHHSPATASTPAGFKSHEGDIVDRGIINMERATEMFARYNDHMMPHLPAVVFPPSVTVSELRKTKPILFLAIMAAAVSEHHEIQRVLQKELMQIFAEKVFMTGEKTLELVQALTIAVVWYWPPEHFEELKFYQLVHIAGVMAIDIGLGKKSGRRAPPAPWKDHPFRRTMPPDPTSIESRRAWLACHFMSANTSMALHRPNLIRWTPFMAECVDILETSPDAAPTDRYFCHLVWTHRLAEDVGTQFSLDDPGNLVNLSDNRTQFALRAFERDMEKYKAAIPTDYMQPSLVLSFNVVSLYMHEMALHPEGVSDAMRPPFMTEALKDGITSSEPLSAAHINAFSACLAAIEGLFQTFLGLDVTSTRCLPVFNFVRVAYGVVILLKMWFSAAGDDSELGRVITKENMRVHYYLDALLEKFRVTAADEKSRPAAKFLVVLAMLRSWFFKQAGQPSGDEANKPAATPRPASSHGPSPQHHPPASQHQPPRRAANHPHPHAAAPPQAATTPLHLLSEVAAGSKSFPPPDHGSSLFARLSGVRQPPQPFFHDTSSSAAAAAAPTPGDLGAAMAPAFPPWVAQGLPPDFVMPSENFAAAGGGPDGNGYVLGGLSFSPNTQEAFEGGARFVMNEPWFSDMFSGMPDPNLFPF